MDPFHIKHKWSLAWQGLFRTMTFDLDIYLQGHSAMTLQLNCKNVTSCHVRSTAHTVLDGFCPYLAKMITSIWRCVACKDLWPWSTSSGSFRHDFAMKLLKYDTSCHVHSTAVIVLYGFVCVCLRGATYSHSRNLEICELFAFAVVY